MKTLISMTLAAILILSLNASAGDICKANISQLLEYKDVLGLTDGQVKKLKLIQAKADQKMAEAKVQADIRMTEIERFTSDWTNMNGTAVRGLLKEYYEFLSEYKCAELNAICQARAVLDFKQLTKFQQLVSIESLMLNMESDLAMK